MNENGKSRINSDNCISLSVKIKTVKIKKNCDSLIRFLCRLIKTRGQAQLKLFEYNKDAKAKWMNEEAKSESLEKQEKKNKKRLLFFAFAFGCNSKCYSTNKPFV